MDLHSKLYLVHICALVLLYQTNTDKCTDILSTHHFINTMRNSNMLQPVSVRLKHVGVTHNVNKSGGLVIYECVCRCLFDIELTLVSVEMWFGNVDVQECKEKYKKV
jgi:hypothetical protein